MPPANTISANIFFHSSLYKYSLKQTLWKVPVQAVVSIFTLLPAQSSLHRFFYVYMGLAGIT